MSSREILCLLKTSRDLQMLFAAATDLVEGLQDTEIEPTLLINNVEAKCLFNL
jgi:hypothetical protein